ncbi:hypothetical protein [Hydrocarboniphaga effusa]
MSTSMLGLNESIMSPSSAIAVGLRWADAIWLQLDWAREIFDEQEA